MQVIDPATIFYDMVKHSGRMSKLLALQCTRWKKIQYEKFKEEKVGSSLPSIQASSKVPPTMHSTAAAHEANFVSVWAVTSAAFRALRKYA